MKTVGILFGGDFEEHLLFVDLFRKGQLHENAVNLRPLIEALDELAQFVSGNIRRWSDRLVVDSEIGGGLRLSANVDLARGVIAHQYNSESRGPSRMSHYTLDTRQTFRLNLIANAISIEN
jgi:hypothetical protein